VNKRLSILLFSEGELTPIRLSSVTLSVCRLSETLVHRTQP